MISAKRTAFRQQIRKRQIEQKFRERRREIMIGRELETVIQRSKNFEKQLTYFMNDLRSSRAQKYYFEIHETLHALKKCIINSKLQIRRLITRQEYRLLEEIAQVLDLFSKSDQEYHNKLPVFQSCLLIVVELISYENVDSQRIINSSFIETLVPYLQLEITRQITLVNIFRVLGNMTSRSQEIANTYNRLSIPNLAIQMLLSLDPKIDSEYLPQFLYFISSYFESTKAVPPLTIEEVNACLVISRQTLNYYLKQDIGKIRTQQVVEDCLKIIKQILNFQLANGRNLNINISTIIDLLPIKNFPINIKKQALFIIDSIVYLDDDDIAVQINGNYHLINKLFGVEEEIRYIMLNILSNLALYPDLKQFLTPHIQRIKLSLNFEPKRKQLYYFILNYFKSQNFEVNRSEQIYLLNQLWKTPDSGPDIIKIQAQIWLGLLSHGYQDRPPLKILQANQLQDVQQILYLLQTPELQQICHQ